MKWEVLEFAKYKTFQISKIAEESSTNELSYACEQSNKLLMYWSDSLSSFCKAINKI